jgi:GNAT superfamily N-acetyltransferase
MNSQFHFARATDIERLLPLMRDFYAFEKLHYDENRLRALLAQLIADPRLGRLILFQIHNDLIGYMVLGFGFSLEFQGTDCFIDEFYVKPEHRSKGIGAAALNFALTVCREAGIAAIHLEADHFNVRGHEFYLRLGFKDHDRHLMTRWL